MEIRPEIRLAVDIDDVAAGAIKSVHVRHYGRLLRRDRGGSELALEITPEDEAAAEGYESTFAHPKIHAFRSQGADMIDPESPSERLFQRARSLIRSSRRVHSELLPINGSQDAITYLIRPESGIQHIGYHTVRPAVVEQTTRDWLRRHEYPNSENVVRTDSPRQKLERLFSEQLQPDELGNMPFVVLVDDGVTNLLKALQAMCKERPEDDLLREQIKHFILVGFGPHATLSHEFYPFSEEVGLQVINLPSWDMQQVRNLENKLHEIVKN